MKITNDFNPQAQSKRDLETKKSSDQNSSGNTIAQDILNITRENQMAATTSLTSLNEALDRMESLKAEFVLSPEKAISAQSNINSDFAYHLL